VADIKQPGIKKDNEHYCALIYQMAQGDEAALTEFYQIFEARVYAFVKKKLNDPADAADLLNTVMLEIWKSASRFEGRSRVTTWVFGIAHNRVIDRLRSKIKHEKGREYMEDLESVIADESEQGLDKIISQKEIASYLNHCMERLPNLG